jgi:hypothetical protein
MAPKFFALLALGVALAACGGGNPSGGSSATGRPDAAARSPGNDAATGEDAAAVTASEASAGTDSSTVASDGPLDGPADAPSPSPTVSSWVGTNVDADLPRVDITYQLNRFDTPAAQLDPQGYPMAGASGTSSTDIGFVLPTGVYKISYQGTGTLSVSGIGTLTGPWQAVGNEQRGALQITGTPGAFGNFLTLKVANGAGQTVTGIHIYMPGFDYDATSTFLPQFLNLLGPFHALRFMGWQAINASKLADWADRPTASQFGASPFGEPYEHITELVNETGKDCWVSVPELASADFIAQFAQFMATSLDFSRIQAARARAGFTTPFRLIVENSNETWNQGFTAYGTFLAAAKANPARFNGTYGGSYGPSWMSGSSDLMAVAQVEADRLVQIGNAFRTAFTAVGQGSAVAPVLSGWALGAAYSDEGLRFIQANYGQPKQFVSYVAHAPYFATPDDTTTGSLTTLFPALETAIAGMDATFQDFAKLGAQYGVGVVAYEGGQSLTGSTHQAVKHLAQHDERMYEAYKAYLALWQKDFGPSLFMHFSLAGTPGQPESVYQYGYWGSIIGAMEDPATCEPALPTLAGTESIASVVHHCPKYRALAEQVP